MPYNAPAATGACLGCGHDDPHTSTLNATCTHPGCGCRDFPARRAHRSTDLPAAPAATVPQEAIDAALDRVMSDLTAGLHERGIVPAIDREFFEAMITRAVEDAAPFIRASAEQRVQELDRLARDMLSRFRKDGFPVLFCPSLAEYDRWRDVLFGEGGTGG